MPLRVSPACSSISRGDRREGVFDPAAEAAVRARVRHGPDDGRATWTLRRLRSACPELAGYSLTGVWRLLHRLQVHLRHGRPRLFSPDPAYQEKEDALLRVLETVAQSDGQMVALFVDEFTYYHWPLPGRTWSVRTDPAPIAQRAGPGERTRRIVGALNALDGRVHTHQDRAIGKTVFAAFLETLAATYPTAERIYIILDNWPVHHSPEVTTTVQALERVELVFLPTYAPWLNPIEKLWRWLRQDVLKMHRWVEDWPRVKQRVHHFLDQFAHGSSDLLRSVGLVGKGKLATVLNSS